MRNYSKQLGKQPQSEPIVGRTDMVQNNAGGYVFKVSDKEQLERFLLLGSEGGTYYVSENKLTLDNAQSIIKLILADGISVVNTVVNFATNRKAPRADASLFVLALAASHGDLETKKAAYAAISQVAYTATHLFTFLSNVQNLRGWSRGLRNGVAKWYTSKDAKTLSYQLVKYRSRNGFTHRDALRLAHPKTANVELNELFKYAVGKTTEAEVSNKLIQTFGLAQKAKTAADLIPLIKEGQLTWEMVPTELLNDKEVLNVLVDFMPLTALIRNLNRFAYNGLTVGNNNFVKKVKARLSDAEAVKRAGIHPVMIINSMKTYEQGRGDKGSKTWEANQGVLDALSKTYELAVGSVVPTNKSILVAADVSGSMSHHNISGMTMTASQVAQVLAVTMLKTEPNAEMINFDTALYKSKFGSRSSIDEVMKYSAEGGGTDCSLPIQYAIANSGNVKYDAIIILTDNETWAGQRHSLDLLREARKVNPDIKIIEVAMIANPSTQFPADEKNLLRVVGFDNSVIDLISKFL